MSRRAFDKMRNGYNRYQVDDYMQKQDEINTNLKKEIDLLQSQVNQLKAEKQVLMEKYQAINDNLKVKEDAANEMARMAMKEANRIVDTANHNADAIVNEAITMARGILLEVSNVATCANDMKSSMQEDIHILQMALDDFEVKPLDHVDLLKKE